MRYGRLFSDSLLPSLVPGVSTAALFMYCVCVTASEEKVHEGVHAVSEDEKHGEAETKETL